MSQLWRGWCLLRPGLLLYGGMIGTNQLHSHHAVQLVVAAESFTMADGCGGQLTTTVAIVPPDTPHTLVVGARGAVLAQLEPSSAAGRSLLARSGAGADAASWGPPFPDRGQFGAVAPFTFARPLREHAAAAAGLEIVEDWVGYDRDAPLSIHPAVARAVEVIPTLLAGGPVRIGTVAAAVHLSPSRLAHLFSAHVGIPLRPYVRWQRLQQAIRLVAGGESLTAAAHSAGFTDGAHFSRVFRRNFGNAPSTLADAIEWVP